MAPRDSTLVYSPTSYQRGSITADHCQRGFAHLDNSSNNNSSFPFSSRRSFRRGSSRLMGSSSSFSSASTQKLKVTFDEHVRMKRYLPDWADERVQEYEKQREEEGESDSADAAADPRRLDACYTRVLRRHSVCTAPFVRDEEWSPRGLETHIDLEHAHNRRKAKLQSALTVLLLQARREPQEEIARHYRSISQTCHIAAHHQGLLDELEAQYNLGDVTIHLLKTTRREKTTQASSTVNHARRRNSLQLPVDPETNIPVYTTTATSGRKSRRFSSLFTS